MDYKKTFNSINEKKKVIIPFVLNLTNSKGEKVFEAHAAHTTINNLPSPKRANQQARQLAREYTKKDGREEWKILPTKQVNKYIFQDLQKSHFDIIHKICYPRAEPYVDIEGRDAWKACFNEESIDGYLDPIDASEMCLKLAHKWVVNQNDSEEWSIIEAQ